MPRTEEDNQRIREEQKRNILRAATKVFAHKGLAATKMTDIATAAEVGYGLLYHYFPGKELLFHAAVERATKGGFRVLVKRIGDLSVSPWERLYQLTVIILEGIQREPEGYLLSQQAITSETVPQETKDMARNNAQQGIAELQKIIAEGQASGQIVIGNPAELAALYFACVGGIAMAFISFHFPPDLYPKPESVLHLLKP
jgi:AcrR family transcriptional regulator